MESPIQSELTDDGTAVINVMGEIDFSNADELAQGIREALAEWAPATLRIDLRQATFIDSTGLGALIEGYRAADQGDARFAVVNPTESFRRVLTVTGLCELFGLDEPAATALGDSSEGFSRTGA
jgi:anti-sigma B factor antagonist